MDIKEEQVVGRVLSDHWYYRSKAAALYQMLRGVRFERVLDIGAGSGIFAKELLSNRAKSAICVDPAYEQDERAESFEGRPIRFLRNAGTTDADLVLLMDVLEHVDDDVGLLRSSAASAAAGAHLLVTVPAFQCLFSAHDRFLEHKRRYTGRRLASVVGEAGLELLTIRYFFLLLLPVAATMRLLSRSQEPKSSLREHSPVANGLLYWLHRVELPLLRVNRLAGLTIFCLARKR